MHSWGKIKFKDRRGRLIGNNLGEDELPTLTLQCNAVRFLFVDEIEATGAETLAGLEQNTMRHVSLKNPWRYRSDGKTVRPFGGVNVCFLGDFWQLSPTGQIAIMSDVSAPKVLDNAHASYIMNIFWNFLMHRGR